MNVGLGLGLGLGSRGGAAFTPKNIAGLFAWYRADTYIAGAWGDQSGTGDSNKNLAQASGPTQPTLNAIDSAYNNQPTLSFSGSQYLRSGTFAAALTQDFTIFIVGNVTVAATTQRFLDGLAINVAVIFNSSGHLALFSGAVLSDTNAADTAPHIFGGTFNNASSSFYDDAITANASGSVGSGNPLAGFTIGVGGDTTTAPLTGKIAEIVVIKGTPTVANRTALLKYLGQRYSIAVGP